MLSNEFLLAVALVLPIVLAFWSQKRDKLAHLRGPESPSLLLGWYKLESSSIQSLKLAV